jgi:hypothetical protein
MTLKGGVAGPVPAFSFFAMFGKNGGRGDERLDSDSSIRGRRTASNGEGVLLVVN